jgi:membrane fusion protein (multidrug efflux system)
VAVGPTARTVPGAEDTVPVTVTVPKAAHVVALGAMAYVRFPIDRHTSVAVDAVAVLGAQQQPFVFTVDRGRVRQQAVVVGISDGSWTEITSGVAAGEDVVISGGQRLVDGAAIQVSRAGAP